MKTHACKTVKIDKNLIVEKFNSAATTYDGYAKMQQVATGFLLTHIQNSLEHRAEGAILEIGCGTGAMSVRLAEMWPGCSLFCSDISPEMVAVCQQKLAAQGVLSSNCQCLVLDAETIAAESMYAAIVSGLTVQWFADFSGTLARIYSALQPGGEFIFSCLVQGSFLEWIAACQLIDVPCTLNGLPDRQKNLCDVRRVFNSVDFFTTSIVVEYPSSAYFFRSLKLTGTNTQVGGVSLSVSQIRRLMQQWDEMLGGQGLAMTYVVDCIRARKKDEC